MASSNLPATTTTRTPSRPAPPSGGGGGGGGGAKGVTIDPVRIALTYWPLVAAAFVVSVVVGVGAYIVLGRVSPQYHSQVIFQVLPPPSDDPRGGEATKDEMEKYMNTQVAIIESDRKSVV